MQKVTNERSYDGNNFKEWLIKGYIISLNRGKWLCSCSIKYKRNPALNCKHITLVKNFLLDEDEKKRYA